LIDSSNNTKYCGIPQMQFLSGASLERADLRKAAHSESSLERCAARPSAAANVSSGRSETGGYRTPQFERSENVIVFHRLT